MSSTTIVSDTLISLVMLAPFVWMIWRFFTRVNAPVDELHEAMDRMQRQHYGSIVENVIPSPEVKRRVMRTVCECQGCGFVNSLETTSCFYCQRPC